MTPAPLECVRGWTNEWEHVDSWVHKTVSHLGFQKETGGTCKLEEGLFIKGHWIKDGWYVEPQRIVQEPGLVAS